MDLSSLAPLEIAGRAGRLLADLERAELDALVVTDLTNLRWLSGFTGSAGRAVLAAGGRLTLIVDGRYAQQARNQLDAAGVGAEVLVGLSAAELLEHVGRACGGGRIGFEAEQVTVAEHRRLAAALGGERLVATSGVIERLRRAKDDGELDRLQRAAEIADRALAEILAMVEHGPTEREVGRALDRRMEDLGAAGPSFETIVASGPNAGKPHHRPGDRRIVDGDALIVDFGALVDGYHSDMTRTFHVGDVDPWLRESYAAVAASQAAGVAAVRAGRPAAEVDAVCRELLSGAGLGELFTHGTGHGVGLLIHEAPWVRRGPGETLAERDVVTVEPGVYRGGFGGVRIEDTVVVTTDGCRPITLTPKDPSCLQSRPTTSRPG